MTVCIAAICEMNGNPAIIGASDRMLTAGDVQFEPPQQKIFYLTSAIAIMTAGDSAMQAEIIQDVASDVNRRIAAEPDNWWLVRDVAGLYSNYYNRVRLKKAENDVLVPLGLNADTYISRQSEMSDTFIRQVASELYSFDAPHVAAIITGLDPTGAHIYVAHDANLSCVDNVAFASVGIGSGHASSQFMFAAHTKRRPLPETLLLTYSAKKRAEVAPGVGEATDMFIIGPRLGTSISVPTFLLELLEETYQEAREEQRKLVQKSEGKISAFFKETLERAAAAAKEQTGSAASGGEAPADQKELRDGVEAGQPEGGGGPAET